MDSDEETGTDNNANSVAVPNVEFLDDNDGLADALLQIESGERWSYQIKAVTDICPDGGDDSWTPRITEVSGTKPEQPDAPETCELLDTINCIEPTARRMRLRTAADDANDPSAFTTLADDASKLLVTIPDWATYKDANTVTGLKIEFLTSNNKFEELDDACAEADLKAMIDAGEEPYCKVEMSKFWADKWEVDAGDIVTARALAKNGKGWSEASQWNIEGAVCKKAPAMMNPPAGTRDGQGEDQVLLEWNLIERVNRSGGVDVAEVNYSLMAA